MGTSLSESTLLDSVRDQNVIVNIQISSNVHPVGIYLPFSFLLFLKEVMYKRIVDMAMVVAKKSPKQIARPIIGPERCGSKVNRGCNNGCSNICDKPSIMRTPFCEHEHNMNSNSGISSLSYVYKDSKYKIQADQECGVLCMCV